MSVVLMKWYFFIEDFLCLVVLCTRKIYGSPFFLQILHLLPDFFCLYELYQSSSVLYNVFDNAWICSSTPQFKEIIHCKEIL